jgi:hypothetical protein
MHVFQFLGYIILLVHHCATLTREACLSFIVLNFHLGSIMETQSTEFSTMNLNSIPNPSLEEVGLMLQDLKLQASTHMVDLSGLATAHPDLLFTTSHLVNINCQSTP